MHPHPVTVLLADDHALVRAGIRNVLEDMTNLEIIGEVGNGPELVDILTQQAFDLLLIDVTMPDFDPIRTIQNIKNDYPAMRILVVSAYDDDVYVQGLLGAGVDGYHLKDQSAAELRLAVQRVLEGERWLSSRLVTRLLTRDFSTAAPDLLSPRQQDILQLLVEGSDNRSIATELSLSIKTVENHLTRLYRQLDVSSRLEAVAYVREHPDVLHSDRLSTTHHNINQTATSNVLIVDDNKRFRTQLQRMVAKANSTVAVYEAESIHSALNRVERYQPELVFIDVVLGEESGIECARKIKQSHDSSVIILMSAYPDQEFHTTGLAAGAKAFLDKKNIDSGTIRQIIDDVVG